MSGLDPPAGVALLERELGDAVEQGQREDAEAIVKRLDGRPQSLVETAALIQEGGPPCMSSPTTRRRSRGGSTRRL